MTEIFEALHGNDMLKSYIISKISEGTLPHALIFEGEEGSGKLTLALMTASALNPEFENKIKKQLSPDVTVYGPTDGKKSIGVSLVREIRSLAYIKPQELTNRVFIIRFAQLMTPEAQNALLKILEEPPSGVFFFLLCENSSALLPTVRSRAPIIKMSVFSDEELTDYLIQTNQRASDLRKNSPDLFQSIIRSSSGSVGNALKRIGTPDVRTEKCREKTDELLSLLDAGKNDRILLFFAKNQFQREELDLLLLNLSLAVRDMLKIKYGTLTSCIYFTSASEAENLSAKFARSTLMNVYSASEELRGKLNVNVNTEAYAVRCCAALCRTLKE